MKYEPRLVLKDIYLNAYNCVKIIFEQDLMRINRKNSNIQQLAVLGISSNCSYDENNSICKYNCDSKSLYKKQLHSKSNYVSMEHKRSNEAFIKPIIVVHWRRGDQLESRCLSTWTGLRDYSVNCGNSTHLINDVYEFIDTNSKSNPDILAATVVVTTNEKNTTILQQLRDSNFIPFVDIIERYSKVLTPTEELLIESLFMMHATLFLGYGISQVNDVVEYERQQLGLPWCVAKDIHNHSNWCTMSKAFRAS